MTEQAIQRQILTRLEELGAYVVKVISASKKGVPDILACYKGKFLAIEVKTPKTKSNVSELQAYNLRKVIESGGKAIVLWDVNDLDAYIKELDK